MSGSLYAEYPVLFEAGFNSLDKKLFCKTDILANYEKGLKVTEVKSGTSLKLPQYILDPAFQYKVIKDSGYDKKLDFYIAYLNPEFEKQGPIDPYELFDIEDITWRVRRAQSLIDKYLFNIETVLSKGKEPNVPIGKQCWADYPCPFLGYCFRKLPKKNIWNIGGLYKSKAEKLQEKGIVEVEQIPRDAPLNEKQWIEVNATIEDKPNINRKKIQEFLDSLELKEPHYYVDFESISPGIPKYDNSKPYTHICFQFCLLHKTGNKIDDRVDFLAEPNSDPRRAFIETLLNATKKKGLIIVYNVGFEKSRLNELAKLFPDLESEINDRVVRLRDLAEPFSQKHYYHPSFNGSYSLKKVLPVLVPELSYDDLTINNGTSAMINYSKLPDQTPLRQILIKQALLSYCYLDVFAMTRIIEELQDLVAS